MIQRFKEQGHNNCVIENAYNKAKNTSIEELFMEEYFDFFSKAIANCIFKCIFHIWAHKL